MRIVKLKLWQIRILCLFFKYLRRKNIYDKYVRNFCNDWMVGRPAFVRTYEIFLDGKRNYTKELFYQSLVFEAFSWEDTDEGFDFWCNIDIEWERRAARGGYGIKS